MADNPFKTSGSGDANHQANVGDVHRAGTALMVVSAISIAVFMFAAIFSFGMLVLGISASLDKGNMPISKEVQVMVRICWGILIICVNAFIYSAASQMRQGRKYLTSQIAACLAIVPCVGPCYILGIPFGIWALIVLSRPEVREAFVD